MDQTERQVIDELFAKLRQAEAGSGPRDAAAETHIAAQLQQQPAAPYYMAQAIVVLEQALEAARTRTDQLEAELRTRPAGGGFLAGIFGGNTGPGGTGQVPPAEATPEMQRLQHYQRPGMGGSFLGGAMQTAMGVAGGMFLGSLLMSAFATPAKAALPDVAEGLMPDDGEPDDTGMDDGGMDDDDL